jgi:predicted Zn-dependent peptidase
LAELGRLVGGGLEPDEIARARRLLVADWVFGRETVSQEALATATAISLFDAEHERRHLDRIESCSGAELSRALAAHLDPADLVIGWSLPEARR